MRPDRFFILACMLAAATACDDAPTCRGAERARLYPAPRLLADGAGARAVQSACIDTGALAAHATVDRLARTLVEEVGLALAVGPACQWLLAFAREAPPLDGDAAEAWAAAGANAERFVAVTRVEGARPTTTLVAASERAALYALETVLATTTASAEPGARTVPAMTVVDWPDFPVRGVVEGFYGDPYSSADRLATLRLMADLRMNTYLYGPKDDPFAHQQWADPYPREAAAPLGEATRAAHARLQRFIWSVSPGLHWLETLPGESIRYGSDADFAKLLAKLDGVRALGVDGFALFLDDLNPRLVWPEDQAQFPSLAVAHRFLVNRLAAHLTARDPSSRLLVVGQAYADYWEGWEAYNVALADGLDASVDVMWTGPFILSAELEAADMTRISEILGRRVVIWDNWPVNLKALDGRSADLPATVAGMFSNPVLNERGAAPTADFWKVLGTCADYMWNPAGYVPATSFARWQPLLAASCR